VPTSDDFIKLPFNFTAENILMLLEDELSAEVVLRTFENISYTTRLLHALILQFPDPINREAER